MLKIAQLGDNNQVVLPFSTTEIANTIKQGSNLLVTLNSGKRILLEDYFVIPRDLYLNSANGKNIWYITTNNQGAIKSEYKLSEAQLQEKFAEQLPLLNTQNQDFLLLTSTDFFTQIKPTLIRAGAASLFVGGAVLNTAHDEDFKDNEFDGIGREYYLNWDFNTTSPITLIGTNRNDLLVGAKGNDSLFGNNGNDFIKGLAGNDNLSGGGGNDRLYGQAGNDRLNGGTGIDLLSGGTGNDTYIIHDRKAHIQDDSGNDTAIVNVSHAKIPTNIENVIYNNGAKKLPYFIDSLAKYGGNTFERKEILYYLADADHYIGKSKDTLGKKYSARAFTANEKTTIEEALAQWQKVGDFTFKQVSQPNQADIRFYKDNSSTDENALGYYIADNEEIATSGEVHFALNETLDNYLAVHEIGHALHLSHPFAEHSHNNHEHHHIKHAPTLGSQEDSTLYTQMSYTKYLNTDMQGPQIFDKAAIHYMFGVNPNTNTGNTVYDITNSQNKYIADAQGNDTITAASTNQNVTISLQEASWNFIGNKASVLSAGGQSFIGFGTTIENATGGSGNDTLTGNATSNTLIGGAGNDTLNGLSGNDVLTGGDGNDIFIIDSFGNNNIDTITDFSNGDTIQLNQKAFTSLSSSTTNLADYVTYENSTGKLFYSASSNVSVVNTREHFATLSSNLTLDINDTFSII